MFDHLPQNNKRIFSSITRKDSHSVMEKARSVISHYRALMEYHPQDVWDIMDTQNRFAYANKNLNKVVGLNKKYDFEGRHMTEPPAACYDVCATDFVEQNHHCLQERKAIEVLDIHPSRDSDWFVYIFRKTPIFLLDSEIIPPSDVRAADAEIVGTLHQGRDVLDYWKDGVMGLQRLYNYFTGKSDISIIHQRPADLTDPIAEVLFLLLCGRKVKEIARILNITEHAARSRVDMLKIKLGVRRLPDIVEAAIAKGYHQHLPSRFTGKQISIILS